MTEIQGLDPLEQVVGQLANSKPGTGRILGIAGCRSGDGASFVVDSLSAALASRTDEQVLMCSIGDLLCCSGSPAATIFGSCAMQSPSNLWKLDTKRPASMRKNSNPGGLRDTCTILSTRFSFVVIDCGAVSNSGTFWPAAQIVDDLLLVVAAGETKKSQIAYAQRLIARSGAHLAGCILNKRTYPLPERLYRLLA
jgi:hypothetical protein